MRWFKHLSNFGDDPSLQAFLAERRLEGYGALMRIMEIVSENFESGGEPTVELPLKVWAYRLQTHPNKVKSIMGSMGVIPWVRVECASQTPPVTYRVTIHKLLELKDEYTRKSGHTTDTVRTSHARSVCVSDLDLSLKKEKEDHTLGNTSDPPSGTGTAKPPDRLQERFDRFWQAYPRKVGKGAARKAWGKLRPSEELTSTIIAAVHTHRSTDDWKREGGRFIPHPSTWLNQERWEDEVDSQPNSANGSPPKQESWMDAETRYRYGFELTEAEQAELRQKGILE